MTTKKYTDYRSWRRAIRSLFSEVSFDGDKDICQAFAVDNFGLMRGVGEWDGERGEILVPQMEGDK